MKKRVRVDFDVEAVSYEDLKKAVNEIFEPADHVASNVVIQSPLCQADFEMDDTKEAE